MVYNKNKSSLWGDRMKTLLLNAAKSGERLEMIYLSEKNIITHRIITVRRIGEEHFQAYCYTKRQIRTFKIKNVLSIVPLRSRKRAN